MQSIKTIYSIEAIYEDRSKNRARLFKTPGIYAFWWIGEKTDLMNGNRKIILKGPNGTNVAVEYHDWWPSSLPYPCLYVGKSTNIWNRLTMHLRRGSPRRMHKATGDNIKVRPKTTSCQLRHGIEHVFPDEQCPLDLINKSVGFSYRTDFDENAVAERFFTEDLYIGQWRTWFNIDSER